MTKQIGVESFDSNAQASPSFSSSEKLRSAVLSVRETYPMGRSEPSGNWCQARLQYRIAKRHKQAPMEDLNRSE